MAGITQFGFVFLALSLLSSTARATDVEVHEEWIFKKRAKDIVKVVTDAENHCDSGCRYRYPSVEDALVLDYKRTPTSFYTWTFVEDIKNSEWFSHNRITVKGNLTVVEIRQVTGELAKKLERLSGKPDDSLFDSVLMRYEIEEIFRDGKFLKTRLKLQIKVTLSGLIALFAGLAESGLEDTARSVARNILSAKDVAPDVKTTP